MITIFRKKTSESDYTITFNEYTFWGFIGFKNGFVNRWFCCLIPFSDGKAAWHFLGFRFTKSPRYVSKVRDEIDGWYCDDKKFIKKLRSL